MASSSMATGVPGHKHGDKTANRLEGNGSRLFASGFLYEYLSLHALEHLYNTTRARHYREAGRAELSLTLQEVKRSS